MPKKKSNQLSPERKARMKKNMQMIVPPGTGMRRMTSKALGRAIEKAFKLPGQAKKVKVNNPLGARQTTKRRRPVRFKITRSSIR